MSRNNETSNSDEPPDLEKQQQQPDGAVEAVTSIPDSSAAPPLLNVVVSQPPPPVAAANLSKEAKGQHSRSSSAHEQCRVCQQDKDEALIDLGCHCRGGLAKAHRSCIDTWFRSKGSNKCEICQGVASNVSSPESQPTTNYWVWRIETTYRSQNQDRGCNPLWVAFSILIGGLMLDVLISTTLGISAVPVNIIIGVIVVLGLGTILRLALAFCHEWSTRSVVQRVETQRVPLGYHPDL
ncbi:PREDICTED: E3 ubiquitin-protein ligase MARCH4 [Fragaria vesca subsp. vesca]|uniref:E3 ubiquitin-protein ligase MARCH4 n=1 Tax=Fragaria vesca subsp. vesca TaxID=101020 RepID=UPI0002C3788F|nr:PREDICTED: E3 ubiquitin-protein ligase MARCH4 [Fragaria vesca subsp. vesca]